MKKMTKKEYLLYFIKHELYVKKINLIRTASLISEQDTPRVDVPCLVGNKAVFINREGEEVEVVGCKALAPIFGKNEEVILTPDDVDSVKAKMKTTFRHVVLYYVVMYETFGNRYPIPEGRMNKKFLSNLVEQGLKDKTITVEKEVMQLTKATFFIETLSHITVPTATKTLYKSSKKAVQVRDELVEKYKDDLDNPVTISKIAKAVKEVLEDEIKGDDSEGFFNQTKGVGKTRLLTHGMIGGVPSTTEPGKMDFVKNSLIEGWDVEDLPVLGNNVRTGSRSRGLETALGGEQTEFVSRIFQDTSYKEEDCGTKVGVMTYIDKNDYKKFVGRYLVGHDKPLDEKKLASLVGKTVEMRRLGTCKSKNGNFCKKCLGDNISSSGQRLGPLGSEAISKFMKARLAGFHVKESRTVEWDFLDTF